MATRGGGDAAAVRIAYGQYEEPVGFINTDSELLGLGARCIRRHIVAVSFFVSSPYHVCVFAAWAVLVSEHITSLMAWDNISYSAVRCVSTTANMADVLLMQHAEKARVRFLANSDGDSFTFAS